MFVEIPREPVELEVEGGLRLFELRQQTIRKSARFLKQLDEAVARDREGKDEERSFEAMVDAAADTVEAVLADILIPTDGGPPLTKEQASDLVLDQRLAILQTQMDLNRSDELSGKVVALVMEIHATRLARVITEMELGLKFLPLSSSTDTTPPPSPTDGPEPKPSSSTDGTSETSGGESKPSDDVPEPHPSKNLTSV